MFLIVYKWVVLKTQRWECLKSQIKKDVLLN